MIKIFDTFKTSYIMMEKHSEKAFQNSRFEKYERENEIFKIKNWNFVFN